MKEVEREYKAHINTAAFGNLEIKYKAFEDVENWGNGQHKDARRKALALEKILQGELIGYDVKRDDEWNTVVMKVE